MAINTAIEFVIGTKRIFLPIPLIEITNQDIFDSANNFLDEVNPNRVQNFVSAGGLDKVPGGNVGLTLSIFDGWTVEWEAEAGPALIEKVILGNVAAFVDASKAVEADIFTPTANVFPLISQSFAPTASEGGALTAAQAAQLIEVWKFLGFEGGGNKVIIKDGSIQIGGIILTITQPDSATTEVERTAG